MFDELRSRTPTAPSRTYHPVKGLGASGGAAWEFVRSAARTAPKDDAKTAQVETQALNKFGLLGPAIILSPTRVGAPPRPRAPATQTGNRAIRRRFEVASKL